MLMFTPVIAIFSSILLGTLAPATGAIKCSEVPRTPQTQPPTYLRGKVPKIDRRHFEKHDKANVIYNGEVAPLCEEAVRVATFNIHHHMDLYSRTENTKDIASDLRQFDPTVVIFQEVVIDPKDHARVAFDRMLGRLGYNHRLMGVSRDAQLGNMIASKYPLQPLGALDLGLGRTVHAAAINIGGRKIGIVGTHLGANSSKTRLGEAEQIVTFLRQTVASHYDEYILGGDMNAEWNSPEIQHFAGAGKLKEVFGAIGAPYPQYTWWKGTTVDFLLVSAKLVPHLAGSYVYHTVSSDHLPIMTDILLSTTKRPRAADAETDIGKGERLNNTSSKGLWIVVVAVALVGIVGGWIGYRLLA